MRTLTINLLAAALLVFSAGSASAYNIDMQVRGGILPSYTSSDTITIDVFLDADAPINLLSVAVLSTAGTVDYCKACSEALLAGGGAGPGAQPSYILYAPGAGTAVATALYPVVTPSFDLFPPPLGFQQVNINYFEGGNNATTATGANVWIASLVYHISGSGTLNISMEPSSAILTDTAGGINLKDQVTITGSAVSIVVPEPATALLIGFGLLGLGLAGSRKL
jgi:hypothetical protein